MDVDLDSPEAVVAGRYLLPPTDMVRGRASTPDAHQGYRVADLPTKAKDAYTEPNEKKALLLEIRGTGGQTVLTPSIVPADPEENKPEEAVRWYKDGPQAEIDLA